MTLTLDILAMAMTAARSRYAEPNLIVIHPRQWRHIKAMKLYPRIFGEMVKWAWQMLKPTYPTEWDKRTVQRAYVQQTEKLAWEQAWEDAA